jgi:hypothetical protein
MFWGFAFPPICSAFRPKPNQFRREQCLPTTFAALSISSRFRHYILILLLLLLLLSFSLSVGNSRPLDRAFAFLAPYLA